MSEEMRKRIPTCKLNSGPLKQGLSTRRQPWIRAGAHYASTHVAWAARIAKRLGVRPATRGFARARLTDLAPRVVIRRDHRMEMPVTLFDQRQWVRNAFENVVLQQLSVARPMAWRMISEPPKPTATAPTTGAATMTAQTRSATSVAFLSPERRGGGFVVHK